MRQLSGRKTPNSAGSTSCPSDSQPSAEASTGSGCSPWLTCGSCCGSPSSSRFFALTPTATVFAIENCPASSITSRSSCFRSSWFTSVNVHAVPPTT